MVSHTTRQLNRSLLQSITALVSSQLAAWGSELLSPERRGPARRLKKESRN